MLHQLLNQSSAFLISHVVFGLFVRLLWIQCQIQEIFKAHGFVICFFDGHSQVLQALYTRLLNSRQGVNPFVKLEDHLQDKITTSVVWAILARNRRNKEGGVNSFDEIGQVPVGAFRQRFIIFLILAAILKNNLNDLVNRIASTNRIFDRLLGFIRNKCLLVDSLEQNGRKHCLNELCYVVGSPLGLHHLSVGK